MQKQEFVQTIKLLNSGLSKKDKTIIDENEKHIYSDLTGYSQAIMQHYNDIYNPDNGTPGITIYLKQSLIREIFQNIIDCDYSTTEVNINVILNDSTNTITFKYNELGFSVSDIISFLSLNHTSKDKYNTGAFGTGAKGAMLSSESTVIYSYRYNKNDDKYLHTHLLIDTCTISNISTIQIKELDITYKKYDQNIENGTTLSLKLKPNIYNEIKNNLISFDTNKGNYINPIDFMFASAKKNGYSINLKINDEYIYSICRLNDIVSFKNETTNEGVSLSLYSSTLSGFTYLLPYTRLSNNMPKYITDWNYNIFSTYELTGQLDNNQATLPHIFINIPTRDINESDNDKLYYITNDRTAIRENKKQKVELYIINDMKKIIQLNSKEYGFYFDTSKSISYRLSFLYEFIEYKIKTSIYTYSTKWNKLLKHLQQFIYIKIDTKYIKLTDFSSYSNTTQYVDIPNNYSKPIIIKVTENYRTFGYTFVFYYMGNKVLNISEYVYKSEFESNNFSSLIIRLLISYTSYPNTNPIWMLKLGNLLNQNNFNQNILKNILSIIKNNTHINYLYLNDENILSIDEKDFEITDDFVFNDLSILSLISSDRLIELKTRLITLFNKTIIENVTDSLAILDKYHKHDNNIKFEYKDLSNPNLLSIKYMNDILNNIDVNSISDYASLRNITSIDHYEWFIGKAFNSFFVAGDKIFNNTNDKDKILSLINETNLFSSIRSIEFANSSLLNNINSDLLVEIDHSNIIINILPINSIEKLELSSTNKIYIISRPTSSIEKIKFKLVKLIDNYYSTSIAPYFEKHVIEPMTITELENFFDEKARAIISFYLNKAVALQPEILTTQNEIPPIQIPKEHIEQWIVQAIDGVIHVGSGHTPVDIIKPGEYGADIKMLSCKVDKKNNLISGKLSNETSIAQNFDTAGSDLDDKFWNEDYNSILEGWINVLKAKLIDYKKENNIKEIFYFILLRAGNTFYLCGCKINTNYLDNLTVSNGTENNVFVQGYINENLGNVKIYKAKKRMELRLLPYQWVKDNLTLKFEIPNNIQQINLRSLDLKTLNSLGDNYIKLSHINIQNK